MSRVSKNNIFNDKTLSSEDKVKKFGFDDNFISFSIRRLSCYEDDVFEYLVGKMPDNIDNLTTELGRNGVKTYYVEQRDINLDGKVEEWIVIFDGGVYVVFPVDTNLKALSLGYLIFDEDMSKFADAQVSVEKWSETQPAILRIYAGQEIFIASVSNDFTSIKLLSEIYVEKVLFSSKEIPPHFQIYYIKPGTDYSPVTSPWIGFRWDDVHQEFRQDLIEYYLFVERIPEKATQMCDNLTPLLINWMSDGFEDTWDFPEKYYVCGLAYELAGDTQKSAEIYLQLWRSFPTTEFAFLAKSKLEPSPHETPSPGFNLSCKL